VKDLVFVREHFLSGGGLAEKITSPDKSDNFQEPGEKYHHFNSGWSTLLICPTRRRFRFCWTAAPLHAPEQLSCRVCRRNRDTLPCWINM